MTYDNRRLEDLDPNSPTYSEDLIVFYQDKLECIQYILCQAAEMIESNIDQHAIPTATPQLA